MKRRRAIITICIIMMVVAIIFSGCDLGFNFFTPNGNESVDVSITSEAIRNNLSKFTYQEKQTVAYFSTVSSLILYDDYSVAANTLRFDNVWAEIHLVLEEIEKAVSVSIATSDLARFNALGFGESVRISSHTANMYQVARDVFNATGGMYDPTIYPLVDLWGFTPRFNKNDYAPSLAYDRPKNEAGYDLPEGKYISGLLQLVDFSKVVLSGDDQNGFTLTKQIPPITVDGILYNAQLDFGGIAKGYAVDCVTKLLQDRGYAYGSFSCGGSSIALLKNASTRSQENGTYRYMLGLSKPRKGPTGDAIYMSVATKDVRLSSSGDYDHSYIVDGIIYSHIINPKTGYPMNTPVIQNQKGIAVLTILSGNADYDDAITTALCVMGFENALRFINENMKNYQMTMVLYNTDHAFYEVVTNIPSAEFAINDTAYILASHLDANQNIVYDGSLLR
jgi:thiamine biosynthesis lipoprotein